jgi:predicted permease
MRIVVFPFCLIVSIYDNIPDETTDFPFVGIKLTALMLLCCGILFLHSYWLFFIATKQWRQWDENKMFREYLVTEQKLKKEKE